MAYIHKNIVGLLYGYDCELMFLCFSLFLAEDDLKSASMSNAKTTSSEQAPPLTEDNADQVKR